MNQIIKNKIDFFEEFIISIGTIEQNKENNKIMINETNYNKAQYNNLIQPFLIKLKPYYHKSKLFYIERPMSYSKFITIIRQISNFNGIKYESKMKYTKSTHYIEYYFMISYILK